jgi:hypothetical protein
LLINNQLKDSLKTWLEKGADISLRRRKGIEKKRKKEPASCLARTKTIGTGMGRVGLVIEHPRYIRPCITMRVEARLLPDLSAI